MLAYLSVNKSSPIIVIGLTIKPLQLLVIINNKILSITIFKYPNNIYSTLQNISDAKFYIYLDPNSQSNADL